MPYASPKVEIYNVFTMYYIGIRFEWDNAKAQLNEKHGIGFQKAGTIWADSWSLEWVPHTIKKIAGFGWGYPRD